jgi:hemerythrin-like metal-binding protein
MRAQASANADIACEFALLICVPALAGRAVRSGRECLRHGRQKDDSKHMSELFSWDAKQYALDIAEMDAQHQVLISMMNELAERAAANAPKSEVLALLKQLGNYTIQHFREEEAYMERIGYPQLETHKVIHRELLSNLRQHVAAFDAGSGKVAGDLLGFLKFWLAAHIRGIDRQYASFERRRSA